MPDAVVIGAGPNGLVAANLLLDAGWSVVVLEAQPEPGGAVRSGELTLPGFTHDLFSAFYPLAAASPVLRRLKLHEHGLRWLHAPAVVANPRLDGSCAVLSRDIEETAASLDGFAQGDGEAWKRLYAHFRRTERALIDALFTPFPPLGAGARLAAKLRYRELIRFARFAVLPARRMALEEFRGAGGGLLFAGNALHTDLPPEAPGSGFYGWLLCMLGQRYGFPVPEGGAGELTAALVRRLRAKGGQLECHAAVERVLLHQGRAVGVRIADGREVDARKAVLADVGAPALYLDLVGKEHLPDEIVLDLQRFEYDHATVKVDWALDRRVPWAAEATHGAGTVHLADSMDDLTQYAAQAACGLIPETPFLVVGQMTTADPSRSPAGTECLWAYTHVPQRIVGDAGGDLTGTWDERETAAFADRVEARIERFAPGFRDLIRARHVFTPLTMEQANANLVNGAVNGGTAQLYQQLLFRPTPALGRPKTPVPRLYLASASAHPSGGVHGAPGANAARAALNATRLARLVNR